MNTPSRFANHATRFERCAHCRRSFGAENQPDLIEDDEALCGSCSYEIIRDSETPIAV